MKKLILLTIVGTVFATASAFAHCGTCGVGEEHKAHDKVECAEGCEKSCCAKKKDCGEACEKPCCAKKKDCGTECKKPCCAEKKAETAAAAKAGDACCSAKLGKAA